MKVLSLLNAIFVPIRRNHTTYYLFLDSAFPTSTSTFIDQITSEDLQIEEDYCHSLGSVDIEPMLADLSRLMGITVSGILGIDFISSFRNISIDVRGQELNFNIDTFDSDFELDFMNFGSIITAISPSHDKEALPTLFDTGAFQCMAFERVFEDYPTSKNWVYPSAMGRMEIDYYNNVDIFLDGENRGNVSFGIPNNLPPAHFEYVLGMNFTSQYLLLIDNDNYKLKFKKSNLKPLLNLDVKFTHGFQVAIENNEIIVSNIRDKSLNNINVGDTVIIPDLDMTAPDRINDIYNKLIYISDHQELEVLVNGLAKSLKPIELWA